MSCMACGFFVSKQLEIHLKSRHLFTVGDHVEVTPFADLDSAIYCGKSIEDVFYHERSWFYVGEDQAVVVNGVAVEREHVLGLGDYIEIWPVSLVQDAEFESFYVHEAQNTPTVEPSAVQDKHSSQAISANTSNVLEQLAPKLLDALGHLERLANHFAPAPGDTVDSGYVAHKLSTSKKWVSELALSGEIPSQCIVPGTGNGKHWKFYRRHVDRWIESR